MTNQNLKPDVRGFFDPVTATWSYVVYADGHTDKRCAVIDTVLDYDIHSGRTKTDSAVRADGRAILVVVHAPAFFAFLNHV